MGENCIRVIFMKTLLSLFVLFSSSSVMRFAGLTSGAVKE